MWGLASESQRTRKQLPVAEAWWVGCIVMDKGPAPSAFPVFLLPWLSVSRTTIPNCQGTMRKVLAMAMRKRGKGWGGRCKKCKWCSVEPGSSCLALTGAGRSPRKEPQTRGAFCPRAWLCKRWGKGQEFVELVLSLEPPLPAGVRIGARVADFVLESLEMRIAAQHAVLFDKFLGFHPLRL